MAVTTETNRTSELTTDGVVYEFDFSMLIHDKSEVEVYYKPTGGRYNSLLLDTNYGVVYTDDGGTVSTDGYSAPLAAGKLLIIRHLELTQQTNWLYNDNHTEQTHQDDFDRAVMRDIQQQEELDRCPKFPTYSATKDITFPEPQAGLYLGWNSAGDNLTNLAGGAAGAPEYLNDLADVDIVAPVNGDLLRYNGTIWTNDLAGAVTFTSITIAGNTLDTNEWSKLDGLDQALKTTDSPTFATPTVTSLVAGTLTLAAGSITDSSGTIDFGNETLNLSGVGNLRTPRLYIRDGEEPDYHLIVGTENTGITANRALYFNVGNANRILTLSGNPTLANWFDQDVRTTASPVFNQVIIENAAKTLIDVDASNDLIIENLTAAKNIKLLTLGAVLVREYIGPTTDTDLLQLAANSLTVNGVLTVNSTDASDQIQIYHNNTDPYIKWNDGTLMMVTDEGTNTNTYVRIVGKGTGYGDLRIFDGAEYFRMYQSSSTSTFAASTYFNIHAESGLRFQTGPAPAKVEIFKFSAEGQTQEIQIYGWRTGDGIAAKSLQIGVGVDAADTASFDGLTNYWFDGEVDAQTKFKVAGTQVVGTRVIDANVAGTINSGDATTDAIIGAIRMALDTHGLLKAA